MYGRPAHMRRPENYTSQLSSDSRQLSSALGGSQCVVTASRAHGNNKKMASRSTVTPKISDMFPSTSKANDEQSAEAGNETDTIPSDKVLHPIFDGKYFKIKSKSDKTTQCVCICLLCNTELSANTNVSTNLYKHVKVSFVYCSQRKCIVFVD